MDGIIEICSIEQACNLLGQCCLHPQVCVLPADAPLGCMPFRGDFYALYLRRAWCGNERYGCGCHDFTTATTVFKAPGETIDLAVEEQPERLPVIGILFAPELLEHRIFADKSEEYTFFHYRENESLHLSQRELEVIVDDLTALSTELMRQRDCHTERMLCEHLSLLLDHSLRFYERQFILRSDRHGWIVSRARELGENYFRSAQTVKTVESAADFVRKELPFSACYLSDLLRTETGLTLPEYLRSLRVELAKTDVRRSGKPIHQIAADLGFPSLQALNYLFEKLVGCTAQTYRQSRGNTIC